VPHQTQKWNFEIPEIRRVFCNRTLNLRSIRAIGYDMDYTLVHYRAEEWETRTFYHLKQLLLSQGWPVAHLEFDPKMVCRGLIIDRERGNILKANRFGFVKQARHGLAPLDFETQRQIYSRTIIDLAESRWVFLNTLFSLSEGCLYAQLVDLFDRKKLPQVMSYSDLYEKVFQVLEAAHMEGRLKADIIADPEKFVILDKEVPLALLDQIHAGKKLMLITNSEWHYTRAMMSYTFDRFLPQGMTWKDLFNLVIVGARKPHFFTTYHPFFEVVTEEGLLRPSPGKLQHGISYLGGSARKVEEFLGLSGDEILYVGDHMFGDVHVTKNVLRWRTALILWELEQEIQANQTFRKQEMELMNLMQQKDRLEYEASELQLLQQRKKNHYGPETPFSIEELEIHLAELKARLESLDQKAAVLAKASTELNNPLWGPLMRAGNDKSYLAYQVERYADVYTSRVSNLLMTTPFKYLRSPRGSLPHDPISEPRLEEPNKTEDPQQQNIKNKLNEKTH
jgi:5'-nucleotidase